MRVLPLFTHGSHCPRCGSRTERVRTGILLRPIRWVLPDVKRRFCSNIGCTWRGFAFPRQGEEASHAAAAR
ncbi:hypothetical protein [Longimicrobium sp.]|uniref:hypothetical protein n=1 Tax=Longimicrobium sp. TaxID=2029185 RepID=UPI002B77879B|nr:hypothetical protein [Longimicrobium sp.]HSU16854.1 hypothetical protein [Longimicrobium sp.]